MNQKELLLVVLSVFLTIVAWVVIELATIKKDTVDASSYHPETAAQYNIDSSVFKQLQQKKP